MPTVLIRKTTIISYTFLLMNAAQLLAGTIEIKAQEVQIPHDLLGALRVINTRLNTSDAPVHKNEIDSYIAYTLIKEVIKELTLKAKKNLMSGRADKIREGSRAIELINEKDLNNLIEYKAYLPILKAIIGDAPVMQLHLSAIVMVVGITMES